MNLKVCYVSTYPPIHCGVAEYLRMMISALRSVAPWVKTYVITLLEVVKEPFQDELTGVHVIPVLSRCTSNYDKLLGVLSSIGGVDILHVQHEYGIFGPGPEILESCIRARNEGLARKIVFTMHTVYHPLSGRSKELETQRRLSEVDAVIVHSYLQEFELQSQGVDPSKIFRIPHGTLINPYLGPPRHIHARRLGIREDRLRGVILAVPGFLRRDKGLDILLEAMKILGTKQFTLVVAGEVRDPEVASIIEEASRRVNLVYLERYLSTDEILQIVALADAIVLPYIDPPGSYAVSGILHLSIGGLKPIIGSRVPRLVELYQYAPRLTVPPKNVHELAKRIEWIVHNYDYAVAYMSTLYGYAARTQWPRMTRRHLELYLRLLGIEGRALDIEPPPLPAL